MENVILKIKESKFLSYLKTNTGKKIVGTILFSGIGIALPQIFHVLAGASAGSTFLPMHIAVLIAALSFGTISGSCVAGISVLSSYMLTGMPTIERLPYMLIELLIYAVVLGMLNKKFNSYISLIGTMIIGRLLYACVLYIAGNVLGFNLTGIMNVWQAVITGIYGILIQLAFVPFIAKAVKVGAKLNE